MSEEEPKPGVVIDVTPDPETAADDTAASPQEPPTTARKSARGGRLALGVAVFALVAVAAAGVFGYRYWSGLVAELAAMDARLRETRAQHEQLQQSVSSTAATLREQAAALAEQKDLLAEQRSTVDAARAAFQQQEQVLADDNLRLQEREAELRAAVADVHRRVGRSGTQWMIAETEYLLRIASHRLELARDTKTARLALGLADQRLRDTQDPGWAGVRAQIARDIARLSAFESPDSAGMAARLAALIEQIPQLEIAGATIGPQRTLPQVSDREPDERSWDTLLDDLWAGLKDSVRIREREEPVQAMLPPEHQFFLYENLRLHLEAARLGLARNDPALFRDNLRIAADWVGEYFDPEAGPARAMREAIDALIEVDIRPELPDISQSLRALLVRQELTDAVAPGGAETP